jgi:hypothetical protein
MVFALIGTSRFPMLYKNQFRLLGMVKQDPFSNFVKKLPHKSRAIVFKDFVNLQFTRRMVMGNKSYNPELSNHELLINKSYIYPCEQPQKFEFEDSYSSGIKIKAQRQYFIPLIIHRLLKEEEAKVFHTIVERSLGVEEMINLLPEMNISIVGRETFSHSIELTLNDSEIYKTYKIKIDKQTGKFMETNVCFDPHGEMFFLEVILLFREERDLFIY